MKILKLTMIIPSLIIILCTNCTSEKDVMDTIQVNQDSYSKYIEYSETPIMSILDLALGQTSLSRSEDCVLGLTQEDTDYLNSLDLDGLLALKAQLMDIWGFGSDEDIDIVLYQAYDQICDSMSAEELVSFNDFLIEYIEMPEGIPSLEKLNVFQSNLTNSSFEDVLIYAAIGIDNFGRILYNSLPNSQASESECKKNFAIRIAITSVGTIAGMIIPGPGWAVAVAAICDAASAAADYANCLNS